MKPKFTHYSGTHNHIANMVMGSGKYTHIFFSCSKRTKNVLGYDQVLLTVKTDNFNEWDVAKELNIDFSGIGFQPW